MTWFKVDDKLHSHRKALRAGVEAMGLWCLAGSWASDQLTDGFVPDYIAQRIDPINWESKTKALVDCGLWVIGEHGGDRGWWFHQFTEPGRNPTREQVLAERAATAERQGRWRKKAAEKRRQSSQGRNAVSNAVNNGPVTPLVTVYPTRPPLKGEGSAREAGALDPLADAEVMDQETAMAKIRAINSRSRRRSQPS